MSSVAEKISGNDELHLENISICFVVTAMLLGNQACNASDRWSPFRCGWVCCRPARGIESWNVSDFGDFHRWISKTGPIVKTAFFWCSERQAIFCCWTLRKCVIFLDFFDFFNDLQIYDIIVICDDAPHFSNWGDRLFFWRGSCECHSAPQ